MAYTKHGRGAAGVGSTRRFGDFGIEQLRQRDARIIESLKLQKAQETERSKDLISQQKDVDRTEFGVKEDIQQLKQDYFQNALAATKLRGRQEGQKGKDLARMIKADAEPGIRMWQQIASAGGQIVGAGIDKAIKDRLEQDTAKNYNTAVNILDASIKDTLSDIQLKDTLSQAQDGKGRDAEYSNRLIEQTGAIIAGKALGGATEAAQDMIPSLIQNTLQDLAADGGFLLTRETIKDSLDRRKYSIGKRLGFVDKNGEWINNQYVVDFDRAWNLKVQEVTRNFSHAKVIDINTSNGHVFFDRLTDNKNAQNLFSAAFNWTLRPQDKDAFSYHSMSDGYRETLMRAAGDKNFLRREVEALGNMPWFITEKGPDFGKPNKLISKKTGRPQTIFDKFPTLKEEVLKERTKWETQWTANRKAAAQEADREDNKNVFAPLLDKWDGRTDLGPIIREMEAKHGKNSLTVTNLKLLQKGSISNYNSQKQEEMLEEAKKNMDHILLVNMLHSSELTGEARKKWREKYFPILAPLRKIGFSSEGQSDKHEKQSMRILKYNTVKSGVTPETLEASVVFQDGIFWEKYEEITTGPNAIAAAGSADALKKANEYVTQVMENLEVISSGGRKGNGPAEFAMFLPGGVSWKDSEKYSISQQEYDKRVADLGEAEAALTDGVVSKEHIGYVITQLINGKTFEPIGFTGQIEGLTRQKFYQHHVDKEVEARGWDFKLVVPKDFKSRVKEDEAFDRSLKKHIQSVRTSTGFWKIMTTEAEGTRSQNTINTTAKGAVNNVITPKTTINESGHETINTNPDLSFEPGSDAPAVLIAAAEENGFNLSEFTKVPTYYGDNIIAPPGSEVEKWLFGGQTNFFPVPSDTPGGRTYWRYIT